MFIKYLKGITPPYNQRDFTYNAMNRLLTSTGFGGVWAGGDYDIVTGYDVITGNLLTKGGNNYSYNASKPHAVVSVGNRDFTNGPNGTHVSPQPIQILGLAF